MATTLEIPGECGVTRSHLWLDHLYEFDVPVQQLNMSGIQPDGRSRLSIYNAHSNSPPKPAHAAVRRWSGGLWLQERKGQQGCWLR